MPPFRADHVGSLLRPPELLRARADHAAGRITRAALRRIEDAAVGQAVRMQEDIGLQGVTDGEFRRIDWLMDFKLGIGGVEQVDAAPVKVPFRSESGAIDWSFVPYRIGSRLHHKGTIFGEDFTFLRSATKATPKLTIPSPSMMHYPGGRGIDRAVYPDMEQYFADLARVYIKEIADLAGLGCTYLQMDDTSLAMLNDPARRAAIGAGRRYRPPALHRAVQQRSAGEARRHDDLHPSLPRQFPLRLARRGKLRARRRGDVQ